MAPACILLDRNVTLRDHPQETEPFDVSIGERAKPVVGATTAELPTLPSREETKASIGSNLLAMTPDLEAVEPPEVSRLTMHRPLSSAPIPNLGWPRPDGAVVAAADKNLVVLYAGSYRPASYAYNRLYLLLDHDKDASSSSSLSAIPGIRFEYSCNYKSAGHGAIIMTREGGAFVLADLLFDLPRRWGLLCLWQSSICSWVYKHGQLPAEAPQPHACRIHMAFPVQSRNRNLFCWVDLLHGLLLWDLGTQCKVDSSDLLDMSFVPLPNGCSVSKDHPKLRNPQEFRNAACVDGTIKFITMDGFMKGAPISLITYTLDLDDPSHPGWMTDTKLLLQDLWVDKTFISNDVPKITPWFPMLSTLEHDIVYLVIPGDMECEEGCSFRGVKLVLSVDMRKTRVISATQPKHPRPLLRWRYLFATSISRSQWGSKYHQGAVEAIEMGHSGKRMKV